MLPPAGITYTWSSTPPYTRWVLHEGQTEPVSYGTRERPFLLLEDFGSGPVPTALYNAVTYPGPPGVPNTVVPNQLGPNDASFVLMQPVRHDTKG
eukprot:SAG31_NODE_4220_length_3449_cov_1.831940_3_plen_95_part_00